MRNSRQGVYFLFVLSLFIHLNSCQYESDSYYYAGMIIPEAPEVGINLADVAPDGTIYIYTKTRLYYSLNTDGKELLAQKFTFEGGEVEKRGDYIYLTPRTADERTYKLEVDITLKTESGSIADIVGVESFIGKYTYNIQFIDSDLKQNIRQEITNDRYLKIIWDNPNLQQTDVDYYELIFENIKGEVQTIKITDPNETSYIDKSYAYGYRLYTLKTYFKDSRIASWDDKYTPQYTPITERDFSVGEGMPDFMVVSWRQNDFECNYNVNFIDNRVGRITTGNNSSYFYRTPFPLVNMPLEMHILPETAENSDYAYVSPINVNVSSKRLGISIYDFSAAPANDLLFAIGDNQLRCYDSRLNFRKSETIIGINSICAASVSTYAGGDPKIAVHDKNGNAYIYNYVDNKFINAITFLIPVRNIKYTLFEHTTNDRLFVADTRQNRFLYVYEASTGTLLHNIPLLDTNAELHVSPDGRYLCEVTPQKIAVYEFWTGSNNVPMYDKVYEQNNTAGYISCKFNPNNPKQLILTSNSSFATMNLYPTEILTPKTGRFVSFDPFTGYILYADANYIGNHFVRILDPVTGNDKWQMEINPLYINKELYLLNNYLITESYYTNTSGLYW